MQKLNLVVLSVITLTVILSVAITHRTWQSGVSRHEWR